MERYCRHKKLKRRLGMLKLRREAQAREYRVLHARQLAEAERSRMRAKDDRDRLERGGREELRRQVIEAEERERHRRVSLAGSIAAVPSPSAGLVWEDLSVQCPAYIRADSSSPSVYETSGGESSSEEGQRRRTRRRAQRAPRRWKRQRESEG